MDHQNRVAAVVVTYNRKELLRQNLAALLNQEEYSTDIIIVDNASSDGTADMISKELNVPQVVYKNTGANLGGAGGFQYGVREAMKNPRGYAYDFVWIMDDDTIPCQDSLKELMSADRKLDGKWGCLSSVAYWTDGSICKANRQKKTLYKFVSNEDLQEALVRVQMASFVSLLVKTSVIKEVGIPIGEYFIWTDDYEFTGRISAGHPIYVVPDSKVLHAMKENKKINFAKETPDRIERYKYVYRNDVHCYRQYGLKGWLYVILKDIYTLLNIILNSQERKKDKMKVVLNGFIEGLTFQPEIEMCHNAPEKSGVIRRYEILIIRYDSCRTSMCEVAA